MKNIFILFILFLATLAVACLYWYPIDYNVSLWKQYISLSTHPHDIIEKSSSSSSEKVIKEPFIPERPLAEVSDAEQKDYDEIYGSYIYNILEWTTLSWVRKMDNILQPWNIVVDQGKVAIKEKNIVAWAFVFDMSTLQAIGEDKDTLTEYLKSDKYLDSSKHPIASFVLQEMEGNILSGILTMSGVSKEISFPALVLVKDDAVRIRSDFSLDRSVFGLPIIEGVNPFLDIHIQWVLRR